MEPRIAGIVILHSAIRRFSVTLLLAGALVIASSWQVPASAGHICTICCAPRATLAAQFAKADAAIFVQCVATDERLGTIFEVLQVARTPVKSIEKGARIATESAEGSRAGQTAVILGSWSKGDEIKWGVPIPVDDAGYDCLTNAPPPNASPESRLLYFLKYLEDGQALIAADAYAEVFGAPLQSLVAIASDLPRADLRRWLADPQTPVARQAGYGMMLGLCGDVEDAAFLEQRITSRDPEREIGIEGMIFGYLLLAGEPGLAKIEKMRLADPEVTDSKAYSAFLAIQYCVQAGNGRIPRERLQAAVRLLLDRPALAEMAITTLTRWKDWSVQERVMNLYGGKDFDDKITKRAIIRYMIASMRDVPADRMSLPMHAAEGAAYLEQLRDRDPKLVEETERFFLLQ
jgi:hypothetical protein